MGAWFFRALGLALAQILPQRVGQPLFAPLSLSFMCLRLLARLVCRLTRLDSAESERS